MSPSISKNIELLAPAKDLTCGLTAINCGADAVYIGARQYGARAKAGNSLPDIETLVSYAHKYWAKIYVTVNTLLFDHEITDAVKLIHQLYQLGVDGVIIQDVGLLECDLPPLPLIASTQMHNDSPEKVRFLEQVGFQRVILARELSLAQIRSIRQQTSIELEFFIHGALCVCYSGQCYLSYALGGRSGNRGECAQPCRKRYRLVDRDGKLLEKGRYLLSIKDLNLSEHLSSLIDAGITSFKIEGRLKDVAYVKNVVSFYRQALDRVLTNNGLTKSASGSSELDFTPDVNKTFNRGYTSYFIADRTERIGATDTPKMVGEFVGKVIAIDKQSFTLDHDAELHNGDGSCFFDDEQQLQGTIVNAVQGAVVYPDKMNSIRVNSLIYRNHDHQFISRLQRSQVKRTIGVWLTLAENAEGIILTARDEDGNEAKSTFPLKMNIAENQPMARHTVQKQLCKMGDTEFVCNELTIHLKQLYFIPLAELNAMRRTILQRLQENRLQKRPLITRSLVKNNVLYPDNSLTYHGNVLNQQAEAFYRRHGVQSIEPAAESGIDMRGKRVMRTKYCLLQQLGFCMDNTRTHTSKEPLFLIDEQGRKLELRFDCAACEMEIFGG